MNGIRIIKSLFLLFSVIPAINCYFLMKTGLATGSWQRKWRGNWKPLL